MRKYFAFHSKDDTLMILEQSLQRLSLALSKSYFHFLQEVEVWSRYWSKYFQGFLQDDYSMVLSKVLLKLTVQAVLADSVPSLIYFSTFPFLLSLIACLFIIVPLSTLRQISLECSP